MEDPAPLTVLRRNRANNQIAFECPTCRKSILLGPASLTEIAVGNRVVSWCKGCVSDTIVSLASLGGFLWTQEQP
jgi:hypothetical protein